MQNNPTLLIVVAAALIDAQGDILLQKRPENKAMAGLWEFPGGKIEIGEKPEAALVREIKEELGITVLASDLEACCFASAELGEKNLILLLYICRQWQGEPKAIESPELGWFSISEMRSLDMPPADLPLLNLLEAQLSA